MRKSDLDPELELKGWKAQRAKFEYEMLSGQEGINYELNYIKAHSMVKKSSDTIFFHRKSNHFSEIQNSKMFFKHAL